MKEIEAKIDTKLQVLSALISRASLAMDMGVTHGGDRNLYETLGYKQELLWQDYYAQYARQDIAAAVIDKPIENAWRGGIDIIETSDADETPLEKAWKEIVTSMSLKSKFIRADKLTCIGQFGILLLGLSDISNNDVWNTPVTGKPTLLYVKVFGEGNVVIDQYESDPNNPRYGMPLIYKITIEIVPEKSTKEIRAHYTRVIHIIKDPLESEIYGTPQLKKVFNRLIDLEKLTGGSAEMFWKGARPGYAGKLDEGYQMSPAGEEELLNQINEYEHNLRRFLINKGISMEPLTPQVSDPTPHVDVQIQMISAETNIPKRILMGSERGELASSQDETVWKEYLQTRREEYIEPVILRPFIERLMQYGILPKETEKYSIGWTDLFAKSDKEKAEVGKIRTDALKQYASEPMTQYVIPPQAFFEFFLGLDQDEIDLINTMKEEAMDEESLYPDTTTTAEPDDDDENDVDDEEDDE